MVEVEIEPPMLEPIKLPTEDKIFGTDKLFTEKLLADKLVKVALPFTIFAFPILVTPVPLVLMFVFPSIVFIAPIPLANIWFEELIPEAFKILDTPIPDTVKKFPPVSPDTSELSPSPETFNELPIFKFGKLLIVVEVATPFTVEVSTPLFIDKLLELMIVVVPIEPAKLEVRTLLLFVRVLVADKLLIVALVAPKFTTPILDVFI